MGLQDLNLRPFACKASTLPNWAKTPRRYQLPRYFVKKMDLQDSDLRPLDLWAKELWPTELKSFYLTERRFTLLQTCNTFVVRLSCPHHTIYLNQQTAPLVTSSSLYRVRTDDFFLVREALSNWVKRLYYLMDLVRARTYDPQIKSLLLCQLS